MATRRRIEPRSAGRYVLSEENPNPSGVCACGFGAEDCTGPYIVFTDTNVISYTLRGAKQLERLVVCAGTAKEAVMRIERGDDIGQVGPTRPGEPRGLDAETVGLEGLRREYQQLAAEITLAELPGWDEWLRSKGLEPNGTPNASSTRQTAVTDIDPDAESLTQV